MKKELSIIHPPIETYQGSSFVLGVLLSYDNVRNVYYNNYINLECSDTDRIFDMNLQFTNALWEDYRVKGIAEMNLFHIKNLSRNIFQNFLKERIDQGNYILLHRVDEYYLSYSSWFENKHYMHDAYIYGYNKDSFYVMAYREGKLKKNEVLYKEIENALFCLLETNEDVYFCTFRPNYAINIPIDLQNIGMEYYNYVNSLSSEKVFNDKVYGINIYNVLIKCVDALQNIDASKAQIDFRPLRCLWEHKKVMRDRVLKLSTMVSIDVETYRLVDELEHDANIVFLLMMKFVATHDKRILDKVVKRIKTMREKELLLKNNVKK